MEQIKIPCTGCRCCTDCCPMKINIPEYLKVLNAYKLDSRALQEYKKVESDGKATDCIGCGRCMNYCPQEILIPNHMSELAKAVNK